MIEIGIVGAKNSGKTTLIESLIPRFIHRGLKVATIKHTRHDHSFDKSGKDSHRHRQAGASLTLALSGSEIALYGEANKENEDIAVQIISRGHDLCLVEGDRRADRPKVLLTRNLEFQSDEMPEGIIVSYGPAALSSEVEHVALDDIEGLVSYLREKFFEKRPLGEQTKEKSNV